MSDDGRRLAAIEAELRRIRGLLMSDAGPAEIIRRRHSALEDSVTQLREEQAALGRLVEKLSESLNKIARFLPGLCKLVEEIANKSKSMRGDIGKLLELQEILREQKERDDDLASRLRELRSSIVASHDSHLKSVVDLFLDRFSKESVEADL